MYKSKLWYRIVIGKKKKQIAVIQKYSACERINEAVNLKNYSEMMLAIAGQDLIANEFMSTESVAKTIPGYVRNHSLLSHKMITNLSVKQTLVRCFYL